MVKAAIGSNNVYDFLADKNLKVIYTVAKYYVLASRICQIMIPRKNQINTHRVLLHVFSFMAIFYIWIHLGQ